ncbi:alpha/beta hydrolase [Nonomuraea sp. NPDC050536]|uniref:alpha/beta hydrolase n=1 Tax=Nonomuraea sp. NPDC050536 TaxID=3364366 RepID=UPI0037C8E2F2
MPLGYLLPTLLVALCMWFALVAPRRTPLLAAISFRLGIVINEVPHVAFYLLLAATLLAFHQGDLDTPGGLATAAVAVLTMAGLTVLFVRGVRAGPVLDAAMADALGESWHGDIADVLAVRLRRRLPLARILLGPIFVRRRDVRRLAGISYGPAGRRNTLDVYHHRTHKPDGPTLVYFHGGGYFTGRKDKEARPLLYRLASQGWVCFSANYRLRPSATFPDHLIDAKRVIAWVRENGQEYGADPSSISIAGSSSGGHLATLCALTPNHPAFQPGFEHVNTTVTAAISLYGYYGNYYGQGPESSPISYVTQDCPPIFLAHGDHDTYVFVEEARQFADTLRSVSAHPVVYAELPGAQHAFDLFQSFRFTQVVDAIEAFTAWVRSRGQVQ